MESKGQINKEIGGVDQAVSESVDHRSCQAEHQCSTVAMRESAQRQRLPPECDLKPDPRCEARDAQPGRVGQHEVVRV
jgi:hypothetical protein